MKHHQIFQMKWSDRTFQSNTMWTPLPSACDPRISVKSCFLMSWAATCAWSILPTCHDEKFPSVLVLLVLPNHSWNFTIKAISSMLKILVKWKRINSVSWKCDIIHNWNTVCQILEMKFEDLRYINHKTVETRVNQNYFTHSTYLCIFRFCLFLFLLFLQIYHKTLDLSFRLFIVMHTNNCS